MQELTTMAQYFRDVRRYPLLSHERELILGRGIQEGRAQWREKLLHHLLHIPLVLACRSRLRRGSVTPADIWDTKGLPSLSDVLKRLDHLQQLRCHMRRHVRQAYDHPEARAVHAMTQLRTDMRALFVDWSWQPTFLHQAWTRFTTGMATTSPVRQYRQVRRYISTLGYSLGELRALWCTLHQLHSRAERAKQEMVTRNLRLVVSVAREFSHLGLPLTDLIQEGNIGLMRAAERYDYRRNLKFSTYAIWWIKQAIRRAVFEQSALIRIPEYMYESSRHVAQAQQQLAAELGRPPSMQEIAERLELPVTRVERSLELVREPISLDRPLWEDEAHTLGETLADTEAHSTQELLVQQALVHHTHRALDQLTPREAEVIRRRFGLHGKPGETLRQIGEDLDLSHERVRQIEAEALSKLRNEHASLHVFLEP
jgi:RNA polymerase sigma factor (sigma-70 family)